MKKIINTLKKGSLPLVFFALSLTVSEAQQRLTIEQCYELAKSNFPLVKQLDLLEKSKDFNLSNAAKMNFPQVAILGQATYQSDVTGLPIKIPGSTIEPVAKDQYKLYAEVYQPLTEMRVVKQQKDLIAANTEVEKQKVEVELYKLKERVNQLFFTILLIDAQLEQSQLLKKDIAANLNKINAAIKNGTSTKMNADLLLAEDLKIDQRIIELNTNKKACTQMLSLFTKQEITDATQLVKPTINAVENANNRPELRLFALQKSIIDVQNKQIANRYVPKAGLFLQTGLGRPALNFLDNGISGYYIGGLRLNWNLTSFYTAKNEKELLLNNARGIDLQKETFLLNSQLTSTQQNTEIKKYEDLITSDKSLIGIRERIKKTATNQLENGIISPLDYITFLNAEDQAKQNLLLHEVQLLMTQYSLKNTMGN